MASHCEPLVPVINSFDLSGFIDAIATKVAEKMSRAAAQPDRVPVEAAKEFGAPSVPWLRERARQKLITLRGPRGGRYVLRVELEELIASSTIRRLPAVEDDESSVDDDAKAAVADMAARRSEVSK